MIPKELRERAQNHPEQVTKSEWNLIWEEVTKFEGKKKKR